MNKTNDGLLNRWASQCLKDSMALHESQLTTTHIDSATYAVPVSVAQEIERLRAGLAAPWKVSDDLSGGLRERQDKLRWCEDEASWLRGEWGDLLKCQAALTHLRSDSQYPVPISTADELPPEGDDILWWHPRALRGWKVGYFEADEEIAPGLLRAGGYCWYLCEGRMGDGPTWWMYPPPAPRETE